jgi:dihydroxy-acid dehydratase
VFESPEEMRAAVDDDDNLDIDATCIMVLKNCGPKGYPGMAEVGNMPLPPKVLKKGITDMVRISDARMSGTAYGTVVLHTAPEAAAGGPLALVQNGDIVELDVPKRKLHLHVSDANSSAAAHHGNRQRHPQSGYWKPMSTISGRPRRRPRLPGGPPRPSAEGHH